MKNHVKSGFTLIELSIVLVIIGLIVGGVLAGQDLLEAAKVRKEVSGYAQLTAGLNAFTVKYQVLPGDMTASDRTAYGINTGLIPGNGNGIIEDMNNDAPINWIPFEPLVFFDDLSASNLIPPVTRFVTTAPLFGPPNLPRSAINPQAGSLPTTYMGGIWAFLGINRVHSTSLNSDIGSYQTSPTMSPANAYALDQKMDDGLPASGQVLAMQASPFSGLDTTAGQCVTGAAGQYRMTDNTPRCRPMVKLR